ncbi:GCN5-related N-acetyltransferase [Ancylobacter novellus DSM 506]|uniref:GCN5-related N-acetyltransferase n=1 Tax=Ancylobacter novellus (strain ATCC 8093 / DSM 506 / JCM 20403 / CCM 1077 / IAM 12100 / NBRC 12443 / NCIMB 10456) TaxID=639283 RepID=D6ZYX4_ANCN5|nr:GNAT family N-acetyltransferase [Ancylobacter novellus]ADH91093.1 GCN5-related N-acetyltransferase [Ancylobacter novellus DSM 506]
MRPETGATYGFRPLAQADFPLLARWFGKPHVAQWWNPAEEAMAEVAQAMAEPWVQPYLVLIDGREAGYIQSYDPHAEDGHPYRDQPPGTLGIDQFIGEPELLGQGHGSAFIARFVERCGQAGASHVVTDPDPTNSRAIRAYEKAGFGALDHRSTPFGRVLLMRRAARISAQ